MNETRIEIDIEQLRGLIGRSVDYYGTRCTVIEVLEDSPALVLEACHKHTTIQPDQHGEAYRRVPTTITVPVLNQNRIEYTPGFLDLNLFE
ncbi:MAG: hypothetical protein FD165_268 [Gammaproteobacteria bacterium]|nr:MAG: hypothetical protein FD165_268 [Gammaproteobacteria bacterium]TND06847.1 MAG: hypothetical protein FD120_579 [Gammaproteobacteria bacterium]